MAFDPLPSSSVCRHPSPSLLTSPSDLFNSRPRTTHLHTSSSDLSPIDLAIPVSPTSFELSLPDLATPALPMHLRPSPSPSTATPFPRYLAPPPYRLLRHPATPPLRHSVLPTPRHSVTPFPRFPALLRPPPSRFPPLSAPNKYFQDFIVPPTSTTCL